MRDRCPRQTRLIPQLRNNWQTMTYNTTYTSGVFPIFGYFWDVTLIPTMEAWIKELINTLQGGGTATVYFVYKGYASAVYGAGYVMRLIPNACMVHKLHASLYHCTIDFYRDQFYCQHYTYSAQHCRDVTTWHVGLYTMCDMAGLNTTHNTPVQIQTCMVEVG
jgi:hypothetical protein